MKRSRASLAIGITLALILTGCGEVYHVRAHNPQKPAGIPFYSIAGACVQETVYATPYYLVTLKISGSSGALLSDTTKLSTAGRNSPDMRGLISELSKPQPDSGTIQTAWANLKERWSLDPTLQANDPNVQPVQFLLRNSSKAISTVDYGHEYSINQQKPFAGSASSDYKLSSDGTLSEAQGQVEDKTLETVVGALPLSDLIKSAAGIASKTGTAGATELEPVHFSLEQEERVRTTTYTLTSAYSANCPTGAALSSTTAGVSTTNADVGAKDLNGSSDNSKKADDSSIGISGTITLPKTLLQQKPSDGSPTTKPTPSGAGGTDNSKKEGNDSGKKSETKSKKPGSKGRN